MNKQLFEEYARLKAQEKEITAAIKALQPELMAQIDSTPEKRVEADFGMFSITTRKTYKYSPAVDTMQEQLEKLMDKEVAEGIAKAIESRSVRFEAAKPQKEDEN